MEIIKFKGKEYPSVFVTMPFGVRRVSIQTLNERLMNLDGSYISEKARLIDEEIFYFVDDEIIQHSKNKIAKLILSEI